MLSPAALTSVEATMCFIALCIIAAHLFGRYRYFGKPFLYLSDYFLALAWLSGIVPQTYGDHFLLEWGFEDRRLKWITKDGKSPKFEDFVAKEHMGPGLKIYYATWITYQNTCFCTKMVFLLTYRRLFSSVPSKRRYLLLVNILIATVIIGYILIFGLYLFWCMPISSNWDPNQETRCMSLLAVGPFIFSSAFHILSDILIYLLPFGLLSILSGAPGPDGPRGRNLIGIRIMFSLGFFCIIFAVARIIMIPAGLDSATLCVMYTLELTTPWVVACLPMIKRLWTDGKPSRLQASVVECVGAGATNATANSTEKGDNIFRVKSECSAHQRE